MWKSPHTTPKSMDETIVNPGQTKISYQTRTMAIFVQVKNKTVKFIKESWKFILFIMVLATPIIFIFVLIILRILGWVWAPWTGFEDFIAPTGEFIRGKTLWDWLQLLIIPLMLSWIAIRYQNYTKEKEGIETKERYDAVQNVVQEIQEENYVNTYIDRITELLRYENEVSEKKWEEICSIGRARTLAVLRRVKSDQRRKDIFSFLRDANLIQTISHDKHSLVNFTRTDLNHLNFSDVDLSEIDFTEAVLEHCDFSRSIISKTCFKGSKLNYAKFDDIELKEVNFDDAEMSNAQFISGKMINCSLIGIKSNSTLFKWIDPILKSNFTNAGLNVCSIYGCMISSCNFENTSFRGSVFTAGEIINSNIHNATFSGARFDETEKRGLYPTPQE